VYIGCVTMAMILMWWSTINAMHHRKHAIYSDG